MKNKIQYNQEEISLIKQRARLVKWVRTKLELTQETLAEQIGVSRRTVQMIEMGESKIGIMPRSSTLMKFDRLIREHGNDITLTEDRCGPIFEYSPIPGEKMCSRCRTSKDLDTSYPFKKSAANKRDSICSTCRNDEYLHIRGLSPEWYEKTLASQGGGCATCGVKSACSSAKKFCADHNHKCCPKGCPKCVRGLLCVRCNVGVSFLENNGNMYPMFESYLSKFAYDSPNSFNTIC